MIDGSSKALCTVAAEPRLGERGAEGVVGFTVGDSIETQFLTIAGRQRRPSLFVEYIAHAEVVELYAHLANHHAGAIAALQVELASGTLLNLVQYVDGAVFLVGTGYRFHAAFLEVAQSDQLALATDKGVAAKQIARTGVQLAHYNLVVGDGVALNPHVLDTGLLILIDTDFYVDGVAVHRHLDRSGLEEEVAIVHVERGDVGAGGVVGYVLLKGFAVVRVAFLDAERALQNLVRIDCVTAECYVAEVEAAAFIDIHLHLQTVFLGAFLLADCKVFRSHLPHCVLGDAGIAVTLLVVVVYHFLEVFLEIAFHIAALFPESLGEDAQIPRFLGTRPQTFPVVHIVRLLHLALQNIHRHTLVACEYQRVYLDLVSTVHTEVDYDAARGVGFGVGGDFSACVAFVDVVALDFVHRRAEHVLGHHVAGDYVQLLLQLVGLAFLDAVELEFLHPWALREAYLEEDQTALDAGDFYLHILKHALFPEVFDRSRHLVAGQLDVVAHLKARHHQHHAGVEVLGALKVDGSYFVSLGGKVVEVVSFIADNHLCTGSQHGDAQHGERQQ